MIDVTFLSENKTDTFEVDAEFALSMYIRAHGRKILFDTGASSMFSRTAGTLGIDLTDADLCVISHGHFDHTLGLPEFCRTNTKAEVYIHENAFRVFYGTTDGQIDDYNCGITLSEEELAPIRSRFHYTGAEPVWITEDIVISGSIPDLPNYSPAEQFYYLADDGTLKKDPMDHEEFLAIREPDGVYLFSGCSHKGIIAAVEYCKTLFPGEHIAGIVAGMHLVGASNQMRTEVIERLYQEEPDVVIPMHCTGLTAEVMMKMKFGDRCILGSNGKTYHLGS